MDIDELQQRLTEAFAERRRNATPAFREGDKVCWSHELATMHADGSIVHRSRIQSTDPSQPNPRFGTVSKVANEESTWFEVTLEPTEDEEAHGFGGPDVVVLTADEIVKVA